MQRPNFDLESHDRLLRFAKDEAERRGWKAKATGVDEDPDYTGPFTKKLFGAGSIVVSKGSQCYSIPYHLPEPSESIRSAIHDATTRVGRYAAALV